MSELSKADTEIMRLATEDAPETPAEPPAEEPSGDDTLELGGEDTPKVEDTEGEAGEAEKEKLRGRPWSKRVDILTARNAEKDRIIAELQAKLSPAPQDPAAETTSDAEPDPTTFEFGEADPKYLREMARHEARSIAQEERTKAAEASNREQFVGKLNESMANIEKAGAEKYDDFEAKIKQAVEARDGEPFPPLLSIGIAVSPAGVDIAYRLASDEAAADKLETLAKTNPKAAALAFGELEGEFTDDDSDLNMDDPLDMARMLGRMKTRVAGKGAQSQVERKTSKAPKPAEQMSRGGGGQFEVADDTSDFRAFEKKYSAKR